MLPTAGIMQISEGTAFWGEGTARACRGLQARRSLECGQDKDSVSGASPEGRGGVEHEG